MQISCHNEVLALQEQYREHERLRLDDLAMERLESTSKNLF
jgi:hypothetical protein